MIAFHCPRGALTVQPWLLYREASWLRRDTVMFGHLADRVNEPVACTLVETRVTQEYSRQLLEALVGAICRRTSLTNSGRTYSV